MRGLTFIAWNKAGHRERFAMQNGNKNAIYLRGHKCWRYTYSKYEPYQDANGATFDTVSQTWID